MRAGLISKMKKIIGPSSIKVKPLLRYWSNRFIGFMIKASGLLDFKIKASGQRVKSLDNKIKPSKLNAIK